MTSSDAVVDESDTSTDELLQIAITSSPRRNPAVEGSSVPAEGRIFGIL
jgi:hypothetical protein